MKFGLTNDQYIFIYSTAVKPLKKNSIEVWCFGSRARGDHKQFSDLDLLLTNGLNKSSQLSAIAEALENSNFPFKVDLVLELNLADSYREPVMRDRVLF